MAIGDDADQAAAVMWSENLPTNTMKASDNRVDTTPSPCGAKKCEAVGWSVNFLTRGMNLIIPMRPCQWSTAFSGIAPKDQKAFEKDQLDAKTAPDRRPTARRRAVL